MEIRRATEADIPIMAILWAMLTVEENPAAKPQIHRWKQDHGQMIQREDYFAYVVVEGGKIVGFANGFVDTSYDTGEKFVEGLHMYVLPEHRKGAAGRMLHKMGTDLAKRVGATFFRRYVNVINERMMKRFNRKKHSIRMYVVDEMI